MIYVTAALLVAVVALPIMLEKVAKIRYGDLEMRRGGTTPAARSMPGGGAGCSSSASFCRCCSADSRCRAIASILLTAWLNQRAFGYDALMLHGDREEMPRLR